jgi:hypothetical protein
MGNVNVNVEQIKNKQVNNKIPGTPEDAEIAHMIARIAIMKQTTDVLTEPRTPQTVVKDDWDLLSREFKARPHNILDLIQKLIKKWTD